MTGLQLVDASNNHVSGYHCLTQKSRTVAFRKYLPRSDGAECGVRSERIVVGFTPYGLLCGQNLCNTAECATSNYHVKLELALEPQILSYTLLLLAAAWRSHKDVITFQLFGQLL
jgi:hypothetical protein